MIEEQTYRLYFTLLIFLGPCGRVLTKNHATIKAPLNMSYHEERRYCTFLVTPKTTEFFLLNIDDTSCLFKVIAIYSGADINQSKLIHER